MLGMGSIFAGTEQGRPPRSKIPLQSGFKMASERRQRMLSTVDCIVGSIHGWKKTERVRERGAPLNRWILLQGQLYERHFLNDRIFKETICCLHRSLKIKDLTQNQETCAEPLRGLLIAFGRR